MIRLPLPCPIEALNGGLFVSAGIGRHETRRLDSYELIFVERGSLELFEEGQAHEIHKGDTLLLRPNRRHGALSPFPKGLRFSWVHFRPSSPAAGSLLEPLVLRQHARLEEPERMVELFRRFLVDQETGRATALSAAGLVLLMLCEVQRAAAGPREAPEDADRTLADRVEAFIAAHFSSDLSSSVIANELGYHPDYLERIFHRARGLSITEAIHRKRIKEARAQLRSGARANINEIAFLCGYRHPSYFRRMFKRIAHLTPKEYRRLYRPMHINTH